MIYQIPPVSKEIASVDYTPKLNIIHLCYISLTKKSIHTCAKTKTK